MMPHANIHREFPGTFWLHVTIFTMGGDHSPCAEDIYDRFADAAEMWIDSTDEDGQNGGWVLEISDNWSKVRDVTDDVADYLLRVQEDREQAAYLGRPQCQY